MCSLTHWLRVKRCNATCLFSPVTHCVLAIIELLSLWIPVMKLVCPADWRRCWWRDWEWQTVSVTRWIFQIDTCSFCSISLYVRTWGEMNCLCWFHAALGVLQPSAEPPGNLCHICRRPRITKEWTTHSRWQVTHCYSRTKICEKEVAHFCHAALVTYG